MGGQMVSFKGTRNGLIIVLDQSREFEDIKNTLRSKMESARGFFSGAKFSIADAHQEIPTSQKDELEDICRQYGMVPNPDGSVVMHSKATLEPARTYQNAISSPVGDGEAALMVRRSLRSGQRIVYPGHVVVLGDIHPGAEVVAGGNVLVLGHCRGVIHAGIDGNNSAKVVAMRLSPMVLSIAGRRFTPDLTGHSAGSCRTARLSGKEIVFE
ncbi:MAG: septum site-determining protein MinC [Desulfotomaculaceae bacterium]|nr:septum site-determining protein MinC [Desulfotomaculaceae bacterium]